jgi:hypothetical protein
MCQIGSLEHEPWCHPGNPFLELSVKHGEWCGIIPFSRKVKHIHPLVSVDDEGNRCLNLPIYLQYDIVSHTTARCYSSLLAIGVFPISKFCVGQKQLFYARHVKHHQQELVLKVSESHSSQLGPATNNYWPPPTNLKLDMLMTNLTTMQTSSHDARNWPRATPLLHSAK